MSLSRGLLVQHTDHDHWYTSVDCSAAHSLIAAVDNKGALITLDRRVAPSASNSTSNSTSTSSSSSSTNSSSGIASIVPGAHRQGPTVRAHRGKANHVEFSKDGNTLATSGNDRAVRLWDVRKVDNGSCCSTKKSEVRAVAVLFLLPLCV
jgi:WD40 repeat protein